jgi:HSP20 family protein
MLDRTDEGGMNVATVVRWDPFREVAALHNELARFMHGVEGNGRAAQAWVPALDVWETDEAVVYAFDLPGVSEEDVSVEVEDGALTVAATRERPQEVGSDRYHRSERRYGSFTRTVGLPKGVDEGAIAADFRAGVLEIRVPKPEQAKPRRIEIRGRGDTPPTIEG